MAVGRLSVLGLLIGLLASDTAAGFTWLGYEKNADFTAPECVRIDYRMRIRVEDDADAAALRRMPLPQTTGYRKILGAFARIDTRHTADSATVADGCICMTTVRPGDGVVYGYTLVHDGIGNAGGAADRLVIPDPSAPCRVVYTVQFPSSGLYRWIEGSGCSAVHTASGDCFRYVRDGGVCHLPDQIRVSSWASWACVRRQYDAAWPADPQGLMDPADLTGGSPPDPERLASQLAEQVVYEMEPRAGHLHQPSKPASVMSRGRGDCKDLALLVVTLLRKYGFKAGCVLAGNDGCSTFPDPLVFTHAYAAVKTEGGKCLYLDPARKLTSVVPAEDWLLPLSLCEY